MASPLTPDDIKNAPPGETVSSVLLNKNLRRIKRPNEKNKVGFQGKTNKPVEAGVKPISAGYKAKPVKAGVRTPPQFWRPRPETAMLLDDEYKKYRLDVYDVNQQLAGLQDFHTKWGLGTQVSPNIALGVFFSPISADAIPHVFDSPRLKQTLKDISAKYQPETILQGAQVLKDPAGFLGSYIGQKLVDIPVVKDVLRGAQQEAVRTAKIPSQMRLEKLETGRGGSLAWRTYQSLGNKREVKKKEEFYKKKTWEFLDKVESVAQSKELTPENKIAGAVGSAGFSITEAIAVTLATGSPHAAAVLFGAKAKGTAYEQARRKNIDPDKASFYSTTAGIAEGVLEYAGLHLLLKPATGLVGIAKKMATEAIQESSQEVAGAAIGKAGGYEDRTLGAIAKDVVLSGAIGAIMGGAVGVTVDLATEQKVIKEIQQGYNVSKPVAAGIYKTYVKMQNMLGNEAGFVSLPGKQKPKQLPASTGSGQAVIEAGHGLATSALGKMSLTEKFMTSFVRQPIETFSKLRGEGGKQFINKLQESKYEGERIAGRHIYAAREAFSTLTDKEANNVRDVLQKKAKPLNENTAIVAAKLARTRSAIEKLAKELELETINTKTGKTKKWTPVKDYWMRNVDWNAVEADIKNVNIASVMELQNDGLKSAREIGAQLQLNPKEVKQYIKEARKLKGKPPESELVKHLIKTKQAKDVGSALRILKGWQKVKAEARYGHLEYARRVKLPDKYYQVQEPLVEWEDYIYGVSKRFTEQRIFGKKNVNIEKDIKLIQKEMGSDYATHARNKFFEYLSEDKVGKELMGASAPLRNLNIITKMSLSTLQNSTQTISDLFDTNIKDWVKAHKEAVTKHGQDRALRTGSVIRHEMDKSLQKLGLTTDSLTGKAASGLLKLNGFSEVEFFNNVSSTLSALHQAELDFNRLIKTPTNKKLRNKFEWVSKTFKINIDEAIKKGKLPARAYDYMAHKEAVRHHFRQDALSQPDFFQTEYGKILLQFKSFMYGQSKLIKDSFKKAPLRTLTILTTVFPAVGELIADFFAFIRGRERPKNPLSRFIENLGYVGGIGIAYEMWQAADYGIEGIYDFLGGPTLSTAVEGTTSIFDAAKGKTARGARLLAQQIPVFGGTLRRKIKSVEGKPEIVTLEERRKEELDKKLSGEKTLMDKIWGYINPSRDGYSEEEMDRIMNEEY